MERMLKLCSEDTGGGGAVAKRGFGEIERRVSATGTVTHRARYAMPDGTRYSRTLGTKMAAEAWLAAERELIDRDQWSPPTVRQAVEVKRQKDAAANTVRSYAERYLAERSLRPNTEHNYRALLASRINPLLGDLPLKSVTFAEIKAWRSAFNPKTAAANAAAYRLLRSILQAAEEEELIDRAPPKIRGASAAQMSRVAVPATLDEIATISNAMPDRLKLFIVLAAFVGLRQGELLELRRSDVDAATGRISVSRKIDKDAVPGAAGACPKCGRAISAPKTASGIRTVHVPPPFLPMLKQHLKEHAAAGASGLLFPGDRSDHMSVRYLMDRYRPAREAGGRPDLTIHHLRHTALTLAGPRSPSSRPARATHPRPPWGSTSTPRWIATSHSRRRSARPTSVGEQQGGTVSPDELTSLLDDLIATWENEVVEFKAGGDGFSTSDIGKYFSALSNEANLRGVDRAWLVFGIDNKSRAVVGSDYRRNRERLQGLKNDIANSTEPRASFHEIYELDHSDRRVLLFEVPPAPRGIPISWNGHYYARNGESLGPLDLNKLDEIRQQDAGDDWSAVVLPNATIDHLDEAALAAAREAFAARHPNLAADEIAAWSTETFLERAKLTIDGEITRAALLLLGREGSAHLLSPLLAEITWKLTGAEQAYEHFDLPFFLNTSKVYERIRNVQVRLLPPGTLIQTEIQKYDRQSVLEGIHNCVAHADYRTGARIVVTEHPDRLVLENAGSFYDGKPEEYVTETRMPKRYRNPFLVYAMTELNMIDRMGFGIQRINLSQVKRFLPLPDFDLTDASAVKLTIYGAVIDTNYSEQLMERSDLALEDVLALDRVQKKLPISSEVAARLKRAHLVEGRRPRLHVSSVVAAASETRAEYIRTRAQSDAHYAKLIIDYLDQFGGASRHDINELLWDKLSDALDDEQKRNKVMNLLTKMRRAGQIRNAGSRTKPRWVLT
jgi:ATP-dependent DNA helicase RecG